MNILHNMKFSIKMSLLVGLFLLVQGITTGYGIAKFFEVKEEIREITERNLPIQKIITDVTTAQLRQVHLLDRAERTSEAIASHTASHDTKGIREEYIALATAVTKKLEEAIKLVDIHDKGQKFGESSLLQSLELSYLLEKIQKINTDFQENSQLLLMLYIDGKAAAAHPKAAAVEEEGRRLTYELGVVLHKTEKFTKEAAQTAAEHESEAMTGMGGLSFVGAILGILWAIFLARLVSRPLTLLTHTMEEVVVAGDYSKRVDIKSRDEVGMLGATFNTMITSIQKMMQEIIDQNWLQSNLSMLSDVVQQARDPKHLSQSLLSKLAPLLESGHAAVYVRNTTTKRYELLASYGFVERTNMITSYGEGERLVGQCVRENQPILLSRVPDDYIFIGSGLGEAKPQQIIVIPVTYKGSVLAVIELATFQVFSPIQRQLLQELIPSVGLGLENQQQSQHTQQLLEETQRQAEELRVQQEELQVQQEELQAANDVLRGQAEVLLKSRKELENSQKEIEEKAKRLEQISQYKSEFLANMSHELRTPLNSLLILAKMFAENSDGNLTDKQVKAGGIIHASGQELLELINNILDLAKVESGRQTLELKPMVVDTLAERVESAFGHIAAEKGLELEITIGAGTPAHVISDEEKVWQILKNFLSNAIKFTDKGRVAVLFSATTSTQESATRRATDTLPPLVLAISVKDSGIGISDSKHALIFEAFQQADGSTSRKYGGTGLGLSISRELTILLRGEIRLHSREWEGSTFTLLLPATPANTVTTPQRGPETPLLQGETGHCLPVQRNKRQTDTGFQGDDRTMITPNDRVILLMSGDSPLRERIMAMAHEKNYKCLFAESADVGLQLMERFYVSGIFVDANLVDMAALAVLQHLKADIDTRHIPVSLFAPQEQAVIAQRKGAVAVLSDAITDEALSQVMARFDHFKSQNVRTVLVAGNDTQTQTDLMDLLAGQQIQLNAVASGAEARTVLSDNAFDCLISELNLGDGSGLDLVVWLDTQTTFIPLPVILYANRDLNQEEQQTVEKRVVHVIRQGTQGAEQQLVEKMAMYLHLHHQEHHTHQHATEVEQRAPQGVIKNQTVLLVDDDVRNLYSLTAALEKRDMTVIQANNGEIALQQLAEHPEIAIILLDLMMPVMDGLATLAMIKKHEKYRNTPVIVLTAKAMTKDREECIKAGASDFVSKPVDIDRLITLMQVWLDR